LTLAAIGQASQCEHDTRNRPVAILATIFANRPDARLSERP
jgi:hypothetical protein